MGPSSRKASVSAIKAQKNGVRLSLDQRTDTELRLIKSRILAGVTELGYREQHVLYVEVTKLNRDLSSLLDLVVDRVTNLNGNLTVKIAWCYNLWGEDEIALRILQSHLKYQPTSFEEELMDINEVNMLMDCQIIMEKLERKLGYRS